MEWDAMRLYRIGRSLHRWRLKRASAWVRRATMVLFSAYLPPELELGEGTTLGYGGIGVLLHPRARIGRGCLVSQMVSIGGSGGVPGAATVGDFVRLGVGARVVGPVHIGDFAVVGPNSVVTRDVPPGAVVFGVPARVVRRMEDPVQEYERDTGRKVPAADRAKWATSRRPERNTLVQPEGLWKSSDFSTPAEPALGPSGGAPSARGERPEGSHVL